jgi:hypothetical protein
MYFAFPPFLSRLVVPIRASVCLYCLYALSINNLSQLRGGKFFGKLPTQKFIFGKLRKDFLMREKKRAQLKEATKRTM